MVLQTQHLIILLLMFHSTFNKIAVKYKTNDFSLFVNGFEVATSNSGNSPLNIK